jgi:hypothetical protein
VQVVKKVQLGGHIRAAGWHRLTLLPGLAAVVGRLDDHVIYLGPCAGRGARTVWITSGYAHPGVVGVEDANG